MTRDTTKVGRAGSRWLWFAGIWAASTAVSALAAYGLRWVLLR